MRQFARQRLWLQRLVHGITVASVILLGLSAPLSHQPVVYAAGQRGVLGQSAVPGSTNATFHRMYLPLVAHQPYLAGKVLGVQMYEDLSLICCHLDLARTAGVGWVRWPFAWNNIEPHDTTPDHYNWAVTDAAFAAAKKGGLKVIATMANNPSWAATYLNGPLDRSGPEPFAEFMAAIVERYDGDGVDDAPGSPVVDYWELYNEPDGGDPIRARHGAGFWGPYGADYAEMLCAVYPAAKAANPNAKIVSGGIAYDWFQEDGGPFVRAFLDEVLAAGGGHCIDALAFHYYPPFESVWAPYGPGLSGKTNYLRSKLDSYGHKGLPLVVTEAGYHSNDDPSWPSTPEIQAGYVVKLFIQAIASSLSMMIWFSWADLPNYWAASGLVDLGRQPKLSYDALKAGHRKLGAASFQRRLSDGETGSSEVEAYLFRGSYSFVYVVWANGADAKRVRLPGKIAA